MQNGLLVKYFNSRNNAIGDMEINKNDMNRFIQEQNFDNRRSNFCTNPIMTSSISLDEI